MKNSLIVYYYRIIKWKIKNALRVGAFLKRHRELNVGSSFQINKPEYVTIHEGGVIGENSRLLCYSVADFTPNITIGKNFHATRNFTVQCANQVKIGDDVLVASDVFLIDYNHGLNPKTASYLDNILDVSEGIIVEDGVWIGNNAVILGGVTIGEKSIVAAGSIVTKSVPAYSIVAGNPARIIKSFNFQTEQWERV